MIEVAPADLRGLLAGWLADPAHGWSIGTFGAIGEFVRDADEVVTPGDQDGALTVLTARGGVALSPDRPLAVIAYDTLLSDGETWGQGVVFCAPRPDDGDGVINALGPDLEALSPDHRGHRLFDLGIGVGAVRMAVRTADPELIAALDAAVGLSLLGEASARIMPQILRAQPHRILLSPAGRLEVHQPIPPPDGTSPDGPHTHLLPKLIRTRRTHSANTPVPDGWQPVLSMHPCSPWRDSKGQRIAFDARADAAFLVLLERFGLAADRVVAEQIATAVRAGVAPEAFAWPPERRQRQTARITLRRLAVDDPDRVRSWRAQFDRLPDDADSPEA